jgi:hypothetical protein
MKGRNMRTNLGTPHVLITFAGCGTLAIAAAWITATAWTTAAAEPARPQAELTAQQARREVRLLDDLYKTAIVYMNDVYVEDADSVAAGETARDLFAAMKAKGWHEARLVDATGKPLNAENAPAGEFEKTAIAKIKEGETYYDEVVERDGQKFLLAATVVPVVNDKCVLCHPGNKVGGVLGAVSYKIPLK